MNHLLILSVLAALPLVEGQEITRLTACTTMTNDLSLECQYKKVPSAISYEWSFLKGKELPLVIASTIQASKVDQSYKNRARVTMTDDMVLLNVTSFTETDNGKYICRLRLNAEPSNDYNKTIPVIKETIPKCGASGLLLNIPLMLSLLLLLPVLQNLGNLPCGNEN